MPFSSFAKAGGRLCQTKPASFVHLQCLLRSASAEVHVAASEAFATVIQKQLVEEYVFSSSLLPTVLTFIHDKDSSEALRMCDSLPSSCVCLHSHCKCLAGNLSHLPSLPLQRCHQKRGPLSCCDQGPPVTECQFKEDKLQNCGQSFHQI